MKDVASSVFQDQSILELEKILMEEGVKPRDVTDELQDLIRW